MRFRVALSTVVLTTTLAALSSSAAGAPARGAVPDAQGAFVRVAGNLMTVAGHPFRFVGANLSIMHGPENRAAADDVLAGAARDGVRVGRIWALGEGAVDAPPWIREHFLFRAGVHGWIDAATDQLDRVIAAAERNGIRLIITLANSWPDYGGVPRYLRWVGRWRAGVYGVTDRFYSDERARAAFRAHVERLLGRINRLTGIPYRDDPTIMAWELMNESTVATAAGARARRAWIVEMAQLIHHRDPNHLVTPGVSGYRFERERRDWLEICRLPEIDFCDGHLYPEDLLRDRESGAVDDLLDDYVRLAQTIAGKPFVLGEFGVRGDGDSAATGTIGAAPAERRWQGQTRAWWTSHILERLRVDGAAGGLIWIYQGARGADRTHGISVDRPGARPEADLIRQAMAAAALSLKRDAVTGADAVPRIGARASADERTTPMPLHAVFEGRSRSVPVLGVQRAGDHGIISITWDPVAFARADWEASGVYGGGPLKHVWGGETGWFEYDYLVIGEPPSPAQGSALAALSVRARLSSEYPGSLSPPDGASRFDVSLDGARLGTGVAPPDDGQGRFVVINVPSARLPANALAPGSHRLRFAVPPGARAHGLALYGRPGEKPAPSLDPGIIELRLAKVSAAPR